MLRKSARLQENGYYFSDGTPTVSYRDTMRRKDLNRGQVCHDFKNQWQSGMKIQFRRQVAMPVVSPPDRGDSLKTTPEQITSVRRGTPSSTPRRVTQNKTETPSFSAQRVTPNNKEIHSFTDQRVTPNKKGTHSFGARGVTPRQSETPSFGLLGGDPVSTETHSFRAHGVTPKQNETPSFGLLGSDLVSTETHSSGADRVTPDSGSSSDTPSTSAGGLFGWIGALLRWLMLLFLVGFRTRLFSCDVYSVPSDSVNSIFFKHSAYQTQQPPSAYSDMY